MKRKLLLMLFCLSVITGVNAQRWAVWWPADGPYGGNIRAIAVGPDSRLYAGTQGGGLFESADNGLTWDNFSYDAIHPDIRGIAINQVGTVFIATMGGGVFKREVGDWGWQSANQGLDFLWLNTIICNSAGDLFVGTIEGGGIYRSTDDGDTWAQINTGLTTTYINALSINTQGHLFAGCYTGIFRSTDNGDTWVQTNSGIVDPFVLSLAINSEDVIFTGLDMNGGMFRSTDNGETWEPINNGMGFPDGINALLVNSQNHLYAGTYGMGIFKTENNGDLWEEVNNGLGSDFIVSLAANQEDNLLAGAYLGGGLYFSDDNGQNWTASYEGIAATNVMDICRTSFPDDFYAATYGNGIYKEFWDGGNRWQRVSPVDGASYFNDIYYHQGTQSIYGTADWVNGEGGLYRSRDAGVQWDELLNGFTEFDIRGVVVNSQGQIFAATYGDGVLRSNDDGITWEKKVTGLDCDYLWSIEVTDSDILFAGSAGCGTGIYNSTDNGETWTLSSNGLLTTDVKVIFFDPYVWPDGMLLAGTQPIFGEGGGIYISYDDGQTWVEKNEGLGNLQINDIESNENGRYFAATVDGVYETYDIEVPWEDASPGPNRNVNGLQIQYYTMLFGATAGNGIREALIEGNRSEDLFNNLIKVYPNPTTEVINFENPFENSKSTYRIYNLNGSVVKEGICVKGSNTVYINNLNTGTYLLKVINGQNERKAIVVIR